MIPEPPPLITHTLGRPRSIYTDLHYCPNSDCKYYGWLARGNICSNGHPNSNIWLQLKCIVCKVIYGSKESVKDRIKQSIGNVINTSFVERMNLTLRHHVPALARRTIQIVKTALGLEQQLSLISAYYNFCLPHSSLRQPLAIPIPTKGSGSPKLWEQRTPAMAAGITDRVLTMEDLLMFRAPPWRQPMPERRAA